MSKKNSRINSLNNTLTEISYQLGCAFNFNYYDKTQPKSVSKERLDFLLNWLKELSNKGISHWAIQNIAGNKSHKNKRFKKLTNFDFTRSNFTKPSLLPDEIEWAEFYLDATFRLVGFTTKVNASPEAIDLFYVVFIDPDHDFCPVKKK